ncbi:MAG: Hsp20/alpha crystallin family protein [Kiritimatiellae bacterium]|nr:Hsp20/alpha crystallin family protein [Kiritimatiellia bacterium]MDD5520093.1 Hsp20/alpha crystallin family protein [Kiritimatiellia bacterium]
MNSSGKIISALIAIIVLLSVALAIQGTTIHKLNAKTDNTESKQLPSSDIDNSGTDKTILPLQKDYADDWPSLKFHGDDWDPFKEMEQMQKYMNNMFDDAFGHFKLSSKFNNIFREKTFSPSLDISDDGDHYTVTIDLPGIDKPKIEVNVDGQTLTISGILEENKEHKAKGSIIRKERRSGSFKRSVTLPEAVKADALKTDIRDGLVKITIPKANNNISK